jgi:hypothetical protein
MYLKNVINLNLDLLNPKLDLAKKQIWCKFEQQCKKSRKQKNNLTNAKFRKEGKDLVTKMEFITIFTNFNVAMDFLSSITYAFVMVCVYILMQLSQTS